MFVWNVGLFLFNSTLCETVVSIIVWWLISKKVVEAKTVKEGLIANKRLEEERGSHHTKTIHQNY